MFIGHVQSNGAKAVEKLAARLPHTRHQQLDVDEILAQHPDIAILDDLAHLNGPEARHPKRFQDVLELLEAGINIYTTLNIYEVASRANLAWEIAGTPTRRSVPDAVLDEATVELVDVAPEEMIRRWKSGNIRFPSGSDALAARLFEAGNLMALREMAARFFAERVAREAQAQREASHERGPAKWGSRVLLAVENQNGMPNKSFSGRDALPEA